MVEEPREARSFDENVVLKKVDKNCLLIQVFLYARKTSPPDNIRSYKTEMMYNYGFIDDNIFHLKYEHGVVSKNVHFVIRGHQ